MVFKHVKMKVAEKSGHSDDVVDWPFIANLIACACQNKPLINPSIVYAQGGGT